MGVFAKLASSRLVLLYQALESYDLEFPSQSNGRRALLLITSLFILGTYSSNLIPAIILDQVELKNLEFSITKKVYVVEIKKKLCIESIFVYYGQVGSPNSFDL